MKKIRYIISMFFTLSVLGLNAQSHLDYLKFGDRAFILQKYASAAYLYGKIFGESSKHAGSSLPYVPFRCEKQTSGDSTDHSTINGLNNEGELDLEKYQYVTYRLAESYRLSYNYEYAEVWYYKSLELGMERYPFTRFWYATMLKSNGKYELASQEFVAFINQYKVSESYYSKKAEIEIAGCYFAIQELKKKPHDIVEKIDEGVNTSGSEFGAAYAYNDTNTIYFTSARSLISDNDNYRAAKRPYSCNIYTSTNSELGWTAPQNIGLPVNTDTFEGSPSLTADGKKMYFTKWNEDIKEPSWAIYVSEKLNNTWLTSKKLNEKVNIPGFKNMHPCISKDGYLLFFSSNRPEGFGKMDLWMTILDDNGEPTEVVNLGERINTFEDELSPFFNLKTNTLFFSSNGYPGFGGYDIFKSYKGDASWSDPENMNYPVNSNKDEMFYVTTESESYGYLSSDRDGSCNCISGYCYNLYVVRTKPLIITLSGTVYNEKTKSVIPNCLVVIEDNIGNNTAIVTDKDGKYEADLQDGMRYYLKTKKATYFSDETAVNTEEIEVSVDLVEDFYLERIPIGEIEIPGILYDFNSWNLRSESKDILKEVIEFLNLNDNIVIEVASHTDERGNDDYNYHLSQNRAKSVINFLIENGIDRLRLKSIGFGEKQLLVASAQTEEDHQKNRRTTFRVLSEDYYPYKKGL